MSYTQQRTVHMANTDWQQERLNTIRGELRDRLGSYFSGTEGDRCTLGEVAAVRYSGQSYAVEVTEALLDDPEGLGEQFRDRHAALYGFATDEEWELVTLRVTLTAPRRARPVLNGGQARAIGDGAPLTSSCWFDANGPLDTPRYARDGLPSGTTIHGPAIIEDAWSTVVLPPGATLGVDGHGHLHIDVGEAP